MDVRVLLHVGLLMETLAAVHAGVRSRIGMDEQVRGQCRRALEAFAARFTLEAALLRVRRSMLRERERMAEALRTQVTRVRLQIGRVRASHVHLQPVRRGEVLAALAAFVSIGPLFLVVMVVVVVAGVILVLVVVVLILRFFGRVARRW